MVWGLGLRVLGFRAQGFLTSVALAHSWFIRVRSVQPFGADRVSSYDLGLEQ